MSDIGAVQVGKGGACCADVFGESSSNGPPSKQFGILFWRNPGAVVRKPLSVVFPLRLEADIREIHELRGRVTNSTCNGFLLQSSLHGICHRDCKPARDGKILLLMRQRRTRQSERQEEDNGICIIGLLLLQSEFCVLTLSIPRYRDPIPDVDKSKSSFRCHAIVQACHGSAPPSALCRIQKIAPRTSIVSLYIQGKKLLRGCTSLTTLKIL